MLRFNLIDIYIKFEYSLVILGYIILCYLFYLDAKNPQRGVFVTPDFGFMDLVSGGGHGGRVVTLSPPTSAAGVRSPSWP